MTLNAKMSGNPRQPSISTLKRNIHEHKILLYIWWNQKGVLYYELFKYSETITTERYSY